MLRFAAILMEGSSDKKQLQIGAKWDKVVRKDHCYRIGMGLAFRLKTDGLLSQTYHG